MRRLLHVMSLKGYTHFIGAAPYPKE